MSAEHTFIANVIHLGNEQGRQRGFIQCLALQRPVYFWSFSVSGAAAICKGGGCVVSTRIFFVLNMLSGLGRYEGTKKVTLAYL